jgi:hypothetical protein
MERSALEIDSWIDSLKIAIIEDKEEKIYDLCVNIPENLMQSSRFEEACALVSGAIEEFQKRKDETKRILNSLEQSKRYFNDKVNKKGRLNIKS